MSLLSDDHLIEIEVFYKYTKIGNNKRLDVLTDEKVKELKEDEEKAKSIESLKTKWSMPTWKEQRDDDI